MAATLDEVVQLATVFKMTASHVINNQLIE